MYICTWTCITISYEEGNLKTTQIWMVLLNENGKGGFVKTPFTLWKEDSILKGQKSQKKKRI